MLADTGRTKDRNQLGARLEHSDELMFHGRARKLVDVGRQAIVDRNEELKRMVDVYAIVSEFGLTIPSKTVANSFSARAPLL